MLATELDFPLIADPQVLALPITENNESLVDLRGTPGIQVSDHYLDANPHLSMVRETVAEKIKQALKLLPEGFGFLVVEGFRPIDVQEKIFNYYYNKLATNNPDWSAEKLQLETMQYVAPPDIVPPHSTGGAFDLTILDDAGNELDMGGAMNEKPHENEFRNYTHAENISDTAKANREQLIDVMSAVGFANYPAEWWHWSYGDRYWAFQTGAEHALYKLN